MTRDLTRDDLGPYKERDDVVIEGGYGVDDAPIPVLPGDEKVATLHPSVAALLKHFQYSHLPPHLKAVSRPLCELAFDMATTLPQDPELTVGLRKLLEAKDCFVRAALGE